MKPKNTGNSGDFQCCLNLCIPAKVRRDKGFFCVARVIPIPYNMGVRTDTGISGDFQCCLYLCPSRQTKKEIKAFFYVQ